MQKLNSLRQEGQEIIGEARKDADRLKDEILDAARKEAESVKARGIKEIELARDAALEQLHVQVVNLSTSIAGQLLGKTLNPEDHKRFITDSIQKIRSMN